MRPSLFLVSAAVLAFTVGCAPRAKQIEKVDTASATAPGTRVLPADVGALPPSNSELAVLKRPPRVTPTASAARLAAKITTEARWDAYLAGNAAVLTAAERRGLILFTRSGCATCHEGVLVGGQEYRRLGEAVPVESLADSGRFTVTLDRADIFVYKVASLRNVQLTAPYLHDGSVKTLGQTVRLMGRHQLAIDLTEDQVSDIRAYLLSLTGKLPAVSAERPPLPEGLK